MSEYPEYEKLILQFKDVLWLNFDSYLDRVTSRIKNGDKQEILNCAVRRYTEMMVDFVDTLMAMQKKQFSRFDNILEFKKRDKDKT